MFGDILSDLTAELSGSLGLGGSVNAGDAHAMAQAAHGSAPDIAGQDVANPFSLILSAGLLLGWYAQRNGGRKFHDAAQAIEQVAAQVIAAGEGTRDAGGKSGTRQSGEAFARRLAAI
jgi:3-isopropylmalate dehydrogenase